MRWSAIPPVPKWLHLVGWTALAWLVWGLLPARSAIDFRSAGTDAPLAPGGGTGSHLAASAAAAAPASISASSFTDERLWNRVRYQQWAATMHRLQTSEGAQLRQQLHDQPLSVYHLFQPTFSCDLNHMLKLGAGDGGKWACIDPQLTKQQDCTVVSIGSNNQFEFEEAVHSKLPHCRILTFDCTVAEPRPPEYVHFYPVRQMRVCLAAGLSFRVLVWSSPRGARCAWARGPKGRPSTSCRLTRP